MTEKKLDTPVASPVQGLRPFGSRAALFVGFGTLLGIPLCGGKPSAGHTSRQAKSNALSSAKTIRSKNWWSALRRSWHFKRKRYARPAKRARKTRHSETQMQSGPPG